MDDPLSYRSGLLAMLFTWDWSASLSVGALLLLLVSSGLISGSEVAFFSLTEKDLDEIKQDGLRKRIRDLLNRPKKLLATLLIANNSVNLAIVILSGIITTPIFEAAQLPDWLLFALQIVLVTFLILLFGEVIPKVYASKYPGFFVHRLNGPLAVLNTLFSPVTRPLVASTNFLDKRLSRLAQKSLSSDELSAVIDMTQDETITDEEKKIWKGIVEFGTIEVKETMTPRTDVMALDITLPFPEAMKKILDSGYSRIPVYTDSLDKIEGILYIKDLLPHIDSENFDWTTLLRPAYFVPEKKKIDDLLKEFQAKKNHIAIVVDEYGGSSGIITLEDVIEEIVGEINDEFDDEQIVYSRLDDENFVFEGKTPLINLCRILEIEYAEIEEFVGDAESLAGLVLQLNGQIPEKNQVIPCGKLIFTVESVDKRRIKRVKVNIGNNSVESTPNGPFMGIAVLLLSGFLTLASCDEPVYNPKPRGYFQIEMPSPMYQTYDSICPFSFEYSKYAEIQAYQGPKEHPCWFNIRYPEFHATLHVTYDPLQDNLKEYLDDSYKLAYNHASKSTSISQNQILDPEHNVFGLLYDLEGDPATTYQFYLTDSTRHFFRASLYFDFSPNYDSLAPVVTFLKGDIAHLIETFNWKK